MDWLRLYLLAGLLLHKAVWEILKRRSPTPPASTPQPLRLRLVKAVKIAILLGIVAQTLLPDILPISQAPHQLRLMGTLLYTAGLALALAGRLQLGDNWLDIEAAAVKREQRVVDRGVYRYIRHPIYVGDLLLLFGLELALNSWLILGVALLVPIVLRQAIREERLLLASLPGYDLYCRRTKRFLPFIACLLLPVLPLLLLWHPTAPLAAQTLTLHAAPSAAPGAITTVDIALASPPGQEPLIVQWDLRYAPQQLEPKQEAPEPAAAVRQVGKWITCRGFWQRAPKDYVLRCVVAGGTATIPNGLLASMRFALAAHSRPAKVALELDNIDVLHRNMKKLRLKKTQAVIAIEP